MSWLREVFRFRLRQRGRVFFVGLFFSLGQMGVEVSFRCFICVFLGLFVCLGFKVFRIFYLFCLVRFVVGYLGEEWRLSIFRYGSLGFQSKRRVGVGFRVIVQQVGDWFLDQDMTFYRRMSIVFVGDLMLVGIYSRVVQFCFILKEIIYLI